jgi:hypothetical protein
MAVSNTYVWMRNHNFGIEHSAAAGSSTKELAYKRRKNCYHSDIDNVSSVTKVVFGSKEHSAIKEFSSWV